MAQLPDILSVYCLLYTAVHYHSLFTKGNMERSVFQKSCELSEMTYQHFLTSNFMSVLST